MSQRWQWILSGIVVALGCAPAYSHHRQAAMEVSVAREERRAAELWARSYRLTKLLALQRQCVAATQCQAESEKVNAYTMGLIAQCNAEQATWHACEARRARGAAESTAGGCFIGWIVSVATGGAAGALTLIGCGVGNAAGESDADALCRGREQPTPCAARQAELEQKALETANLRRRPTCQPEPMECAGLEAMLQSLQ